MGPVVLGLVSVKGTMQEDYRKVIKQKYMNNLAVQVENTYPSQGLAFWSTIKVNLGKVTKWRHLMLTPKGVKWGIPCDLGQGNNQI